MCQEEGTWFLAGIGDFSSGCLRPRAFSPLQIHSPWISHVTRGAYLEDQLAWDWGPEGEETETQTCPPHTEHGGEQGTLGPLEFWEMLLSMRKGFRGHLWNLYLGGYFLSLACGLRPEAAQKGMLWPWLAEVHVAGDRVCTGILVAPGWVLAATHCVLRWVSLIS